MNIYRKRAAQRIALVSVILAAIGSPVAWLVSRENAEEEIVSFAIEESRRPLAFLNEVEAPEVDKMRLAQDGANALAGGIFDIAEIYDARGKKLAEQSSPTGSRIESLLSHHERPAYRDAYYENKAIVFDGQERNAIRVFVPLFDNQRQLLGYFEGVRLIPKWQITQISSDASIVALMVAIASLLSGLTIYPVVAYLSRENERKTKEIFSSHISMMEALGRAIAKRDSDTGAHNYRVAWMSAKMGERIGLSGEPMQGLIIGSFLHDVGKIGIPDAILLKPGKHSDDEMHIMRTHVAHGEEIVHGAGWLPSVAAVVAAHHEKWNGEGYPRGLKGAGIPLEARIFAIVDVFDALCSKRPYKEPFSFEQAVDILKQGAGNHFDPELLDVFLEMAADIHATISTLNEEQIRSLLRESMTRHFVISQ
ncbi:MAG: HD-GYP domain-containing protein [Burkholderiales bacterium]|nr:HD-GYP domain-containing protein [Burkholderiales bacterium]